MEIKKLVLKLELHDNTDKQRVMRTVSGISGIDSISIDLKEKKLTVTGDVDPVCVVSKLRKRCHTEIVSVGPAKETQQKKKEEPKKEEPKKPADDKKKDPNNDLYIPSYNYYYVRTAEGGHHHPSYYYCYPCSSYHVISSQQEYPNPCIIC